MKPTRTLHLFVFVVGVLVTLGAGHFTGTCVTAQTTAQTTKASEQPVARPDDTPFFMLNILWFKPDGGAEKYDEYLRAAGPFVVKHGGKPGRAYVPEANIIGEFDADLVFFVEWPSQKTFTEFLQDPGYKAISHLRTEAIRDSRLVRCKKKSP